MSTPRLLGAVLAGGESRRFGRDKAAEVLGGVTLVDRAARTLGEVFANVVVVSTKGTASAWPTIPDLRPPCGPLGGIEAALREAEEAGLEGVFVLACDLPLVGPETVRAIAYALGDADAVAPARDAVPPVEPLCAIYRIACLGRVTALLDEGQRAAHILFDSVDGATVTLATSDFLNVNTVADRRRAESELSGRRP